MPEPPDSSERKGPSAKPAEPSPRQHEPAEDKPGVQDLAVIDSGPPAPLPRRRRARPAILAVLLLIGAAGGLGWYFWRQFETRLPPGIAWGNGRLEAEEIDIETKFPGRVAELFVDEGGPVKAGQKLARMDTADLETTLKKDQAKVGEAEKALEQARASLVQQRSQLKLAEHELDRTRTLVRKDFASKQLFDQRQQHFDAAKAALATAEARIGEAGHALEAARQQVALDKVNIADNTLRAPTDGRIQYRIAHPREVLPAGGKVFTMLDTSDVYMDVYLPTSEAGRVKIGAGARILLDAYPHYPVPAKVSFIAGRAQFTPKTVETRTERERLMFRVRLRVDAKVLRAHADAVRTGLPGVAYVRLDPEVPWPPNLQVTASQ